MPTCFLLSAAFTARHYSEVFSGPSILTQLIRQLRNDERFGRFSVHYVCSVATLYQLLNVSALQFIAIMCSALFAGAALYVSIIEHPARMSAGISIALQEFRPSYRRAAVFQIIMAVVTCVSSFALSLFTSQWIWFLGGGMTGLMLPFTLIFIIPTNRILLDATSPLKESDAQKLLDRWGRLHLIRTIAGVLGFAILLAYSLRTPVCSPW